MMLHDAWLECLYNEEATVRWNELIEFTSYSHTQSDSMITSCLAYMS